jgi:hypothetical protein
MPRNQTVQKMSPYNWSSTSTESVRGVSCFPELCSFSLATPSAVLSNQRPSTQEAYYPGGSKRNSFPSCCRIETVRVTGLRPLLPIHTNINKLIQTKLSITLFEEPTGLCIK